MLDRAHVPDVIIAGSDAPECPEFDVLEIEIVSVQDDIQMFDSRRAISELLWSLIWLSSACFVPFSDYFCSVIKLESLGAHQHGIKLWPLGNSSARIPSQFNTPEDNLMLC